MKKKFERPTVSLQLLDHPHSGPESKRNRKESKMSLAPRRGKVVSKHEIEIVFVLSVPDSPRATTQEIVLAGRRE